MADSAVPEKPLDFDKSFQKLKPETFFRFWADYPNQEWISVYAYRLWPIIDRKQAGKDVTNIAQYAKPVSQMEFLREHGSGRYHFKLTDANKPESVRLLATTIWEVEDPDFPPVILDGELVMDAPENKTYIARERALGRLKEAKPMAENAGVPELVRLNEKLIDKLTAEKTPPATVAQPSVREDAGTLRELLAVAREMSPAGPTLPELLKAAKELQQASAPPVAAAPTPGWKAMYDEYKAMREVFGERRSGPSSSGPGVLEVIMEFAKSLPQMLMMFQAIRTAGQAAALAPAAGAPALPPFPIPSMETPTSAMAIDPDALLLELKPRLLDAVMKGMDGGGFAAGVIAFKGEAAYEALRAIGIDGLKAKLAAYPEVAAFLAIPDFANAAHVWITEFVEYGAPADGESVEGEVAAAAESEAA